MKKILALTLALAMLLAAAACGSGNSGGDAGTPANTVVIAIGGGFDTLDPGYTYEKNPPIVINACYENLFKFYSNDGAPQPCLVDSYEFSPDNKTLTCVLKDGIKFASGNVMSSEDVRFSIMRVKNLQSNPSFICDTIESIDTPDEKTVVFNLTEPDSAILSKLTYCSCCVLDSKLAKEHGATDAADASSADSAQAFLNTASLGSGMYILKSYVPDYEIVLEKNPSYWGEATSIDKYIIKIQPDVNTQMMTLKSGDIDIACNMSDDTMAELAKLSGISLLNSASKTVGFIMMNMDEKIGGPVSNEKVQAAVRKAIDYAGICTICGEGTVTPYSIIQEGFMGSRGERPADYTDIEAAKALMAEAGYADGFAIDLKVCDLDMEGILLTDLAQKIKSDLAQINIDVNIVPYPWAAGYGDEYRNGSLGFTVMYWGTDYNDPNVQLEFLPGATVGLRAGWSYAMDPEIAAYYTQITNTTDDSERAALLMEMQDKLYEYGPFVMIAQAPVHMGYNASLSGVAVSDPYVLDLTLVDFR